jgi:uncharacterized protein (TIGR00159 family)
VDLEILRLRDLIDVLLVAFLIWIGIVWLRRSRARFALAGIAIVGVIYLLASRLELQLTAWILQGFFAVFIIFVVVVFQEDLRRLFEQIAIWGLQRRSARLPSSTADSLVRAVSRMASTRTGALLVIPGREPLDRYLEAGVSLDAWLSEPLLLSLFDTRTPGHDGAVVLAGNRITRFGVHLPLSSDRAQLGPGGTRHAAALGLAERSDALCIVVSEERGSISIARDGRLRGVAGVEELSAELQRFLERGQSTGDPGQSRLTRGHLLEGFFALVLAAVLWFLLVPGASTVEVQRLAPVLVENLPEGYALIGVEPEEVEVTLSGRRRELVLGDLDVVQVHIDALLVELGRRTFQVSPSAVEHPDTLRVVGVSPKQVRLSVRRAGDGS